MLELCRNLFETYCVEQIIIMCQKVRSLIELVFIMFYYYAFYSIFKLLWKMGV